MITYKNLKTESLSKFIKGKAAENGMILGELARQSNEFPQRLSQALAGSVFLPDNMREKVSNVLNLSKDERVLFEILQCKNNDAIKISEVEKKPINVVALMVKLKNTDKLSDEQINAIDAILDKE